MNEKYELMACIYDWKYKYKSPFTAFISMIDEYVIDKVGGEDLKLEAVSQYKDGHSIQDIELGGRRIRFMICENSELLHEDDKPKFLDFR